MTTPDRELLQRIDETVRGMREDLAAQLPLIKHRLGALEEQGAQRQVTLDKHADRLNVLEKNQVKYGLMLGGLMSGVGLFLQWVLRKLG